MEHENTKIEEIDRTEAENQHFEEEKLQSVTDVELKRTKDTNVLGADEQMDKNHDFCTDSFSLEISQNSFKQEQNRVVSIDESDISKNRSLSSINLQKGATENKLAITRKRSPFDCCGSPLLPWDQFSRWMHCICVVAFDLELGQALEVVYPGHAKLTSTEKMNICYLAFPDSNSGCMGDTRYHFRMRRFSGKKLTPSQIEYNERAPVQLRIDPVHYFGFVYFRQTKDRALPRGYLQKSVVMISLLPLVNLFGHVLDVIAPSYFASGEPGIEAACHDLDQWSEPVPGQDLNLPLMGCLIQCRIPSRYDLPNCPQKSSVALASHLPTATLLPTVHEPHLYEHLGALLPRVQLLWELVLTNEPLVVMSTSPGHCANTVQSLVSLIWPLSYATDYRPYFTIHDSEFKEYTSRKREEPPSVILGVTNPFFTKTLQRWPHILRVATNNNNNNNNNSNNSNKVNNTQEKIFSEFFKKFKSESGARTLDGTKTGVTRLYSQYKPFLVRDKAFIKRIQSGNAEMQRPAEVQSMILRRYFLEVTQSFVIPLERYLASLMPLQRQISPFKAAPKPRQFNLEEFLSSLDESGPGLTSGVKGDWAGLYRRFVQTENFAHWLGERRLQVDRQLQMLHLDVLCNADFSPFKLKSRHEVELVDLILKLLDKIEFANTNSDKVSAVQRGKLQQQMNTVLASVDDDLRHVLLSNIDLREKVLLNQ